MANGFRARGLQWPFFIVGLLAASVLAHVYFVYASVSDPSVVVERDYYKKALQWDALREQEAANAALGWRLEPTLEPTPDGAKLVVELKDATDTPVADVRLEVEAFHSARAAEVLTASLAPVGERYEATLPARRVGLWELRFAASRGDTRFTQTVVRELRGSP